MCEDTRSFGRHSLTRQFSTVMIALVAGTVILCWILNTIFLGRFYMWNKSEILSASYKKVDTAAQAGSLDS